jgi:alpha-L-fucosidase 2
MKLRPTRRTFLTLASTALASTKLPALTTSPQEPDTNHTLWFTQPAAQWADALPIGNGRIGGMIYGYAKTERIALNEDTLWSGFPRNHGPFEDTTHPGDPNRPGPSIWPGSWNNPTAAAHLPVIRKLVLEDKDFHAAGRETQKMQGSFNQSYEPIGDLEIEMHHSSEITSSYRRSLNLDTAVTTIVDGAGYTREAFVSTPAQVMVVRLTSSKPGGLSATIRLKSQLRSTTSSADKKIQLTGKAPSESVPGYLASKDPIRYSEVEGEGMNFAIALEAVAPGGTITSQPDGSLLIEGATSAVLYLGMATGYKGFTVAPDTPARRGPRQSRRPARSREGQRLRRVCSPKTSPTTRSSTAASRSTSAKKQTPPRSSYRQARRRLPRERPTPRCSRSTSTSAATC